MDLTTRLERPTPDVASAPGGRPWVRSWLRSRLRPLAHPRSKPSGRGPFAPLLLTAALLTLAACFPAPGTAQGAPPLAAQGQQPLAFGELLGGVPRTVSPDDPVQAARYRIRVHRRTVQITFLLPTALARPGGGELPLSFGSGDAIFTPGGGPRPTAERFDPTQPWVVSGQNPGWSEIGLGGTVHPPVNAPIGTYRATIVLTLADLGT